MKALKTLCDLLRAAILHGITKFNVYADCRLALNAGFAKAGELIRQRPDKLPDAVFKPLVDSLAAQVRAKIRLAGAQKMTSLVVCETRR